MRVLNQDGDSVEIREEDILYFSSYKNTISVQTAAGEFIYPASLSDVLAAYGNSGFERLDRSNVVNLKNITDYDKDLKVVRFGNLPAYATVSESNAPKIKRILESRKQEGPT
ncbi:MAG TPA: LytTR family DNA-binding domain-containing protein [Paenibacillus sp.]|uniref:LytTR family DNA-binding domain-containing protein n=1 Tax=Paenibacillus sp. TaxID=58172 RepID=UPI0028D7DE2E|nr:LytTR family DNA-binding domain-containing protein [Paenibacillus sp.]HUC93001.1 LytTR family DNA-binding domain-containing protein [Paenibacillus sp.]